MSNLPSSAERDTPADPAPPGRRRGIRRAQYPQELANWALVSVGVGAVEGAVAATLVKTRYSGAVSDWVLDLAVALVAGAPAWSNLASFLFAAHQLGRDKIRWTVRWQALALGSVAMLALVPGGAAGLLASVLLVLLARIAWVGVITLRAVVWRRNFPDAARARLASKLSAFNALLMAASGATLGWLLGHAPAWEPVYFALVGGVGLYGAWRYRRLRLRGHQHLRAREAQTRAEGDLRLSFASFRKVLGADPGYARYMRGMFIFGTGNLMLPAPLLLILGEQLKLSAFEQVLLVATLPLLVLPLAIGRWAQFFDRVHIVEFRAVHAWSFVCASLAFLLGCVSGQLWLLVLGSVLLGVGYAGGQLGWNLGHNDFARPEQAALYMGVHVTLTGIRGLLAPLLGVASYRALESLAPGHGAWMLLLALALNISGAISFRRQLRERAPA
ncbi:MAG: MFS transporter [Lysobacterales bacterium]